LTSRFGFSSGVHEGSADYACGAHLCSVNVKGEVTKCGFFEHGVGNLAEISLKEGWERIVENYLPKLSELTCAGCKYFSAFRGGCYSKVHSLQ